MVPGLPGEGPPDLMEAGGPTRLLPVAMIADPCPPAGANSLGVVNQLVATGCNWSPALFEEGSHLM